MADPVTDTLTGAAQKAAGAVTDTAGKFLAGDDGVDFDNAAADLAWEKLQAGDIDGARQVIASAVLAKSSGELSRTLSHLPVDVRKAIYDDIAKYPNKAMGELLNAEVLRNAKNQEDFQRAVQDFVSRYQGTFDKGVDLRNTLAGNTRGWMATVEGFIGACARLGQVCDQLGLIELDPATRSMVDSIVERAENYSPGRIGTEGDIDRVDFNAAAGDRPITLLSPEELTDLYEDLGEALSDEISEAITNATPEQLEQIIRSLRGSEEAYRESITPPSADPTETGSRFEGETFSIR